MPQFKSGLVVDLYDDTEGPKCWEIMEPDGFMAAGPYVGDHEYLPGDEFFHVVCQRYAEAMYRRDPALCRDYAILLQKYLEADGEPVEGRDISL